MFEVNFWVLKIDNLIIMSVRTGNFFINFKLEIRTLQLPIDQYRQMRRKSILFALNWLESNVLCKSDLGHHLRERINKGVNFDDPTNTYLMNSCLYWKSRFESKIEGDSKSPSPERPKSSTPGGQKNSPDLLDRPMSCPRPCLNLNRNKAVFTEEEGRPMIKINLEPRKRKLKRLSVTPILPLVLPQGDIYRLNTNH
jgi:hypothetical protein